MNGLLNRFGALLLGLTLFACGGHDDDHEEHEGEDPGEHACEAFEEGGAMALDGSADRAGAPRLVQGEDAYAVSLDEDAPRHVRLRGPTEGLLFAGTENIVSALYHEDETEDLLPGSEPNEFCGSDIPEHFDLDLADGDYYIELSPSAASEVWLLFTSAEGHGHEE